MAGLLAHTETFAFCVSLVTSLVLTPVLGRVARRVGLVDVPDGRLKLHGRHVPYLGGVALFLAFAAALVTIVLTQGMGSSPSLAAMMAGATLVVFCGIVDDWLRLWFGVKFIMQAAAASATVLMFERLPFGAVLPYPVNCLLHILWLMAMMNAVNMLDVMDGLAASVAFCASMGILVLQWVTCGPFCGQPAAIAGAALAGAISGFIPYNLPRARIFLGDAGSALLGFLLGSLMVVAVSEGGRSDELRSYMVYPTILSIAIFELVFVTLVRVLAGRNIFRGSPDHFALRLREKGFGERGILPAVIGVGVAVAVLGIGMSRVTLDTALAVFAGLVAIAGLVGVAIARRG